MAKFKTSKAYQQRLIDKYGADTGLKVIKKVSTKDFVEIGCRKFRIGSKRVKVVGWNEKGSLVNVKVDSVFSDGSPHLVNVDSVYSYPFHNIYQPFFNFEVLDDINYLDRFANGERINDRYGIVGGRLVVDGKYLGGERYLLPDFEDMKIKIEKREKFFV